jgi:hypothetical protein
MVDLQLVYLPFSLVRSNWRPWYEQDIYEENNTAVDAYGPLESVTVYRSAIWDKTDPTDYYYFVPNLTTHNLVRVELNMPNAAFDLNLAVYKYDEATGKKERVGWSGELSCRPEQVILGTAEKGQKYLVRVIPDWTDRCAGGNGEYNPYELQAIYP